MNGKFPCQAIQLARGIHFAGRRRWHFASGQADIGEAPTVAASRQDLLLLNKAIATHLAVATHLLHHGILRLFKGIYHAAGFYPSSYYPS